MSNHPEFDDYSRAAPELVAAAAIGCAPARAVFKCPLCTWSHEVPPVAPGPGTLADVFGPGVMMMAAIAQRTQETEKALQAHLSSHQLVEWVQRVSQLERELANYRAMTP